MPLFNHNADATVRADFPHGPLGLSRPHLVPLAIIAVLLLIYGAAGGYWLVTGELPAGLGASSGRTALEMPPTTSADLLRPPGSGKPVDASADTASDPTPDLPTLPAAKALPATPAGPPPVPAVTIPQVPAGPAPAPQLATLPPPRAVPPLIEAPVADLMRMTPSGPLPVIAEDGRTPWQTYARPFSDNSGRARVAVVVSGLGLSKPVTEAAISKLPADVTLAFSPYSRDLANWLKRARAAGHEVLVELPMEARRFPERDPGPLALSMDLAPATVTERLHAVLGKGVGYVGVLGAADSPFATSGQLLPVLQELRKRGLLYAGDRRGLPTEPMAHPAFAEVSLALAGQPFRAAIDARLEQVVATAKARGSAVATTQALPVTIERLSQWLLTLSQKGAVLAPVSALAAPPISAAMKP